MQLASPPDVERTSVTLRVQGPELEPGAVTALLGCEPTHARKRGDVLPNQGSAVQGLWMLSSQPLSTSDLSAQMRTLFSRLTTDPETWKSLVSGYQVDLYCGLWATGSSRAVHLDADVLAAIAERGLRVGVELNFITER